MKPFRPTNLCFAVALICAVTALTISSSAWATHFRSGQIFWRSVDGATIEFTVQDAFRRSFLPFVAYRCRDPGTLAIVPCSAPDGLPGVGDFILEEIGDTVLEPGDGSQIGNPLVGCPTVFCLVYEVTSIDPENQSLFAEALDPASLPAIDRFITHTFPVLGDFLAFIDSGDRIEAVQPPNEHINNPEGTYRIETLVNVGTGNTSPVSALPAIVNCPIDALCEFLVPGSDADGDPLSFRLSTSAEASSFDPFVQPGPPDAPNPASIDAITGLYSWDTIGATLATDPDNNTLYSTQVTIEDPTSKVAVDFFIKLVEEDPDPPVIEPPPGSPPICETTQVFIVGNMRAFDVIGSDPEPGDIVTLNVVGLPAGATMTPSLPVLGNPISSTFAWTPDATQVGMFLINFSASSTGGGFALCPVTLDVIEKLTIDIDIKPGSFPNSINTKSKGKIPVAILSTPNFDAPNEVDKDSPTFGAMGNEDSLAFCNRSAKDVNNDGLQDQVCHFNTQNTGFLVGDTVGILKAQTVDGTPIEGSDSVRIVK